MFSMRRAASPPPPDRTCFNRSIAFRFSSGGSYDGSAFARSTSMTARQSSHESVIVFMG